VVIAYHLVLTCYGFWLPNDPRGSWSQQVTAFNLRPFGAATKVHAKQSVASRRHDVSARMAAKKALAHAPIRFDGVQARAVMRGMGDVVALHQLVIYAACVMPDHVHLIVGRHDAMSIEAIGRVMKAKATLRLNAEGLGFGRSPWARGQWSVFLRDDADVRRAIAYVDRNPIKAGLKPQRWSFVTPLPA
jgi:REP element-mobilizing transposase RayT